MKSLISKYNVSAPRYTSYPTVPAWNSTPTQDEWKEFVKSAFNKTNSKAGISLYIHLPFCESLCTYCACNTRITVNHGVEAPYLESVLKEWQLYLNLFDEKPCIKEIHLGGGTPTFFSPANLKRLLDGILSTARLAPDHDFSFEGHPSNTTADHLKTLFDLGFRRVSFGIQDFDLPVQDMINRYQSYEEVAKVVSEARRIGYTSINFDLVYGLPLQNLQTMEDTINKVIQLKPDRIAFYSYAHVPWMKPGQRKFTEKDLPVGVEKRKLYELGLVKFSTAGYKDIGLDHFALPADPLYHAMNQKKLHRNFMGYTDRYTALMISLGVSAISDTWNSLAQNIKVVEPYRQAIEAGLFPIFKGHMLSEEDRFIRQTILNIICHGETEWQRNHQTYPSLAEGLLRCKTLESDGLLKLMPGKLVVSEKGKSFLRNICMCFDKYYWEKALAQETFSTTV